MAAFRAALRRHPGRNRRDRRRARRVAVAAGVLALGSAAAAAAGIDVEVSGVAGDLEANIRARLSIAQLARSAEAGEDPESGADLSEGRVRRLHMQAPAEIVEALRPFGRYAPVVRSSLESDDDGWTARYEVDPGEPTLIDELDIRVVGEGRDAEAVREALRTVPLASGDELRHQEYQAFKRRLFDAAYNAGYLDTTYERAELRVRPSARAADVHLVLDTGPRYYFGEVVVEQDVLDSDFVDRLVAIEAGDPFNADRLIELQLSLGDSGYFDDVSVDVQREDASNRRIPVRVRAMPRPNQEFTIGVGYGTDTGPRLRFGAELRRLNRRGHRFNFDSRVSAVEKTVAGEYRIPVSNLATDYVSYRASLGTEEIGGFDTEQLSIGGAWNDLRRGIQRRFYVEGRREDFATDTGATRSGHAVYPGVRFSAQRADDPLLTRDGYAWSVDMRGSVEELASTSFARLHATGDFIRPLGERGRLLVRGQYGAIHAEDFARLVPSQRFFAGGDRNVRGYEYQSLGPTDAEGAVTGGRYLVVGSVELDYLFVENYGGAVFFDAGNAGSEPWPDVKRSVGIGLRWRTPVGMLRVDFAHPLDDPDEDFRLHLSIGASL